MHMAVGATRWIQTATGPKVGVLTTNGAKGAHPENKGDLTHERKPSH